MRSNKEDMRGPITGKYRFPKDFMPPIAPEGKVVTKFDGNVAFISAPQPGEERNPAGFTLSQVEDLMALNSARVKGNLEKRSLHGSSISIVEFK